MFGCLQVYLNHACCVLLSLNVGLYTFHHVRNFFLYRHTMSGISLDTGNKGKRAYLKDFCVATPEEFVKSFGGNIVINKVHSHKCLLFLCFVLLFFLLLVEN